MIDQYTFEICFGKIWSWLWRFQARILVINLSRQAQTISNLTILAAFSHGSIVCEQFVVDDGNRQLFGVLADSHAEQWHLDGRKDKLKRQCFYTKSGEGFQLFTCLSIYLVDKKSNSFLHPVEGFDHACVDLVGVHPTDIATLFHGHGGRAKCNSGISTTGWYYLQTLVKYDESRLFLTPPAEKTKTQGQN